jgi:hypothetical protein
MATKENGWPKDKSKFPPEVAPYYDFRNEMAVADGVVFRGERLVIPKDFKSRIKQDIHTGHTGIESCLRRAREYVYWPGMNSDIKQWIQKCETCGENEQKQMKETLIVQEPGVIYLTLLTIGMGVFLERARVGGVEKWILKCSQWWVGSRGRVKGHMVHLAFFCKKSKSAHICTCILQDGSLKTATHSSCV